MEHQLQEGGILLGSKDLTRVFHYDKCLLPQQYRQFNIELAIKEPGWL